MKKLVWICLIDGIPDSTDTVELNFRDRDDQYSDEEIAKLAILQDYFGNGGNVFCHRRGFDNKPSYVYTIDMRVYDHSICFGLENRIKYVWYMIDNADAEEEN